MAIVNPAQAVSITTGYLNLPITAGLSNDGYWYLYYPTNPGNTGLLSSIKPYHWDTVLPLAGAAPTMVIDGTMPFISETWNGVATNYHGGCIEWIGPGINDVTNAVEDDAFFFAHLGTLSTSPDDDIFYWDRAFEPEVGTDWEYYQYHQHSPTFYATWENGRQTIGANGYIDPSDKAYGYMITTKVKVSGVDYASVMVRVHTPSVGGAHNSHNDVTLPAVANKNYLPCGIIRGAGERFHCFYISANGSQWDLYNRTYVDASSSFTAQVFLGTYDFADPTFNPSLNQQSQYPVRAGAGVALGAKIYFPVILNNSVSGYDLEIWSFNSLDTIAGGSLTRQVLVTGQTQRPDCFCTLYGTDVMYVQYSDITNGGTRVWSYNGTTWTNVGAFITNGSAQPVRIHGFQFNTQDFKFYTLASGTVAAPGNFVGTGLYTFQLDTPFAGYEHLDYDYTTNSFIKRAPLEAGYIAYDSTQGTLTKYFTAEPQAIGANTNILKYTQPANQWFNKKSIGFGGKDFYYQAITLRDGRRFAVGQIQDNPDNRGLPESGDFLVSIYQPDLSSALHFAAGTGGDDYLTACWESQTTSKIWMSGYCKGQVVPKGDIWIHGWCRNMSDGGSAMEWRDIARDSSGNVYLVGSHDAGWTMVAKYNSNYEIQWQKVIGEGGVFGDNGYGITVDASGNIWVAGSTAQGGLGSTDALVFKMDTNGDVLFAKAYGDAGANVAVSICSVVKGSTNYIILPIVTGTTTVLAVVDTAGTLVEQYSYSNLVVNRVRPHKGAPTSGRFLFAGSDGANAGRFGMCEVLSLTTQLQWVRGYTSGSAVEFNDIVCSDSPVAGLGAGFVACGSEGTLGLLTKVSVDEVAGVYTVTESWKKNLADSLFNAIISTPLTDTTRYVYAVGTTNNSGVAPMGMDEGLMTKWAASNGTLDHQNVFGHDMDERWVAVTDDALDRNIIVAGWSESHSDSRDAVFFRYDKHGFGTGVYNLTETGTMPYYYNIVALSNTSSTATFTTPVLSGVLSAYTSVSYLLTSASSNYTTRDFDGAFGPNGLFTMVIAYLDLELLQTWLNGTTYKEALARGDKVIYFDDVSVLGGFYQIATVGDGSADDGNIFGYDVIEHSNGKIYAIGQTSGDIVKQNLGLSGVYDYLLVELDPLTGNLEFYQNGTVNDEETYALTEISDGRIAYVGRTTGNLGSPNEGGYDIFLGIFDPDTEVSSYYSIGSGLDDAALNVHDLNTGSNELAIVYFSYGSLTGTTNSGSQDIGVVKFNYQTNTWGTAWQTGSETSEIYVQNGKPSALISNDRIAITTSSVGVFSDTNITYGYLDVCIAILNFVTGEWTKYQIGTTANEIASSCSSFGDILLIAGNSGGSFTDDIDAIFVEFDALEALVGISSSI